ncbi:polyphosphate kinase 1 [Chitinophagaceae bacterium LWZ2-11]
MQTAFFNRDLSWLSFNERVLTEAEKETVPLLERINFLSIYSSNLDEFYRVRIPALEAIKKITAKEEHVPDNDGLVLKEISRNVNLQLARFGSTLENKIIPGLQKAGYYFLYKQAIPEKILPQVSAYFYGQIAAFLQIIYLKDVSNFFSENNQPYILVVLHKNEKESLAVINIPTENLPRFFTCSYKNEKYILFLDDIIKHHLPAIFRTETLIDAYSFKITRDAELDLQDEYEGDLAEKIEKQIEKRDLGLATRLLYDASMPVRLLHSLTRLLQLKQATIVTGGRYHNLRDLASLPVKDAALKNEPWPPHTHPAFTYNGSLYELIDKKDILLNLPYHAYNTIFRFFNEAVIDENVTEIYVTLYRVAQDSHIVQALMNAALNSKKVTVFVELKARFDEANNIKWAKKMKKAGVIIIYSIPGMKVHAKTALIKRVVNKRVRYTGLMATGNFNESTARFYTDHVLLTSDKRLMQELETLFLFLQHRASPEHFNGLHFKQLLIPGFNLKEDFIHLIDKEISFAKEGKEAHIIIKMNNLEEQDLISKLYEASQAGVKIQLLIRGICCLIPGVKDMSENITVTRIVGRYLEHSRVFIFNNLGDKKVYLGSADWMNRNIYRRIEVCFPIYDETIKKEILTITALHLQDNLQAVIIDADLNNVPVKTREPGVEAQKEIYKLSL